MYFLEYVKVYIYGGGIEMKTKKITRKEFNNKADAALEFIDNMSNKQMDEYFKELDAITDDQIINLEIIDEN